MLRRAGTQSWVLNPGAMTRCTWYLGLEEAQDSLVARIVDSSQQMPHLLTTYMGVERE